MADIGKEPAQFIGRLIKVDENNIIVNFQLLFDCSIDKIFTENMSVHNQILKIRDSFQSNLHSVDELLDFDKTVLDFAIRNIEELSYKLNSTGFQNQYLSVGNTLKGLQGIREHDSMQIRYKRIFNQFLVLLVSHFASTIRDLFETAICEAVKINAFNKINKTKIEVSLLDLQNDIEKTRPIGEILTDQKDISFQDMQSINRAFQEYFEFSIQRDNHIDNIILAQGCRHAIVHSGAKVDKRLQAQVASAIQRNIKPQLELNTEILFSPEEIREIGASMKSYLEMLFSKLEYAFSRTNA